jgi:TPR repeat protein
MESKFDDIDLLDNPQNKNLQFLFDKVDEGDAFSTCTIVNLMHSNFYVDQIENYFKHRNDAVALVMNAELYIIKKQFNEAMEYIKKLCNMDNSDGFRLLGFMYENGWGTTQNYQKAKELYEKSYEMKNLDVLMNFGYMLKHGHGVEKNYERSFEYYTIGYELGRINVCNNLGFMYHEGLGTSQNISKAKELYEIACKTYNKNAMYNLGHIYNYDSDNNKNIKKATEYYEKAYMLGYPDHVLTKLFNIYDELGDYKNASRIVYIESQKGKISTYANVYLNMHKLYCSIDEIKNVIKASASIGKCDQDVAMIVDSL